MQFRLNLADMSDRMKILLFLCMSAGFVLMFCFVLYFPGVSNLGEMKKQHEMLLKEVGELDSFLKKHPDLDAYLLETDRVIRVYNSLLPYDSNISAYIVMLNQLAGAAGVKISSIAPGQWVDRDKYQEISINATVSGTYPAILKFLKFMEDNPRRFTTVKNLNIAADDKKNVLSATMAVLVYSWKEKDMTNRYINTKVQ